MRLSRLALAGALAAAFAVPASAQIQLPRAADTSGFQVRNAGDLAELCTAKPADPKHAAKVNFCLGYAQGVVSLEQERAQANKPDARKFCFTSPAPSRIATMEGFAKWIASAPANNNLPAADSIMKYLVERYPCKPA